MKKKILSLLCGMFMMVFSLFSLCACSLVKTNNSVINSQNVVRVGNVNLDRSDIISSFYTYYQNNSNYFAYYDNQTIEDSFYTWATIREILSQKAEEALYDPETNPDGFTYYTDEDEKEVWEQTFEYIYSQVSAYEQAIYKIEGYEEVEYPIWIQTDDEEESSSIFEAYESKKPEAPDETRKDRVVDKSTEEEVKARINDLKKYLFEYVVEEVEDGDDVRENIDETGFIVGARNQAYAKYIEGLVSNAKSNGTSTNEKTVLENELVRIYEAYYSSKISTLMQDYYLKEELVNSDLMSDRAVVEAFLKQYYSDVQTYQVENSYIATMTNTDGASLVLYHYNGQNYFFTVQQILVGFDDATNNLITKLPGYTSSSSSDYDEMINSVFVEARNELAENRTVLTKVNLDNGFDSIDIESYAKYYYYDEKLSNDESKNFGYIEILKTTTTTEDGEEKTIFFEDVNKNGLYEEDTDKLYYDVNGNGTYEEGVDKLYSESNVTLMATKEQVLEVYVNAYNAWCGANGYVTSYYNALTSSNQSEMDKLREDHEDMIYVFDTIDNMYANGSTLLEIKEKVASYLFLQLEWVYSSDSLGNELSNKIGYVVSNYKDENSSWVTEFAVGARELLAKIEGKTDEEIAQIFEGGNVNDLLQVVTTNYGYHILKIENIYRSGESLVDISDIIDNANLDDEDFVNEMVQRLKNTYVSTASNQTLYDYFYDSLYTSYAGDSSTTNSSGSYFYDLQYKWLNEYYKNNNIEFIDRMTYEELMESIQ